MSEMRTIRSIGVQQQGVIDFFSYEEAPPPPGHFRIETLYTGLSAGTELTFYKGTNPYLHSRWDDFLQVFCEDQASMHLPLPFMGYMEVGRVTESLTPAIAEGQIVSMTYGHKTGHTANAMQDFYVPLPDDIDPILGIYVAQMGPICANGLLHAAVDQVGQHVRHLGDGVVGQRVLVIGGGVVGLLTGLFAQLHGASEVAVADRDPARLNVIQQLGLTAINENEIEAWRYCKENWHDNGSRGADSVFQCRGKTESLQVALRSLRPQGTVIDLAFYQEGATPVRLGEEFHHNGLSIRCAQISRVPRGLGHTWSRRRLAEETIQLLRAYGKNIRKHMITDVARFDDAPLLFEELAQRKRPMLQVVFKVAEPNPVQAD